MENEAHDLTYQSDSGAGTSSSPQQFPKAPVIPVYNRGLEDLRGPATLKPVIAECANGGISGNSKFKGSCVGGRVSYRCLSHPSRQ